MFDRFRKHAFGWWAGLISGHPWWVIFLGVVGSVAAVVITVGALQFEPDRNKLIDQDLPWNQWFIDWTQHFAGTYDLWVIVDAGAARGEADYPQQRSRAVALVDELGPALRRDEHIVEAVWGFRQSEFSPRTVRLLDMPEFQARLAQAQDAATLLASDSPQQVIQSAAASLTSAARKPNARKPDSNKPGGNKPDGNRLDGNELDGNKPDADDDDPTTIAQALDELRRFIDALTTCLARPADKRPTLGQIMEGAAAASPAASPVGSDAASPAAAPPAESAATDSSAADFNYQESDNGRLFFIRVTPRRAIKTLNALGPAIKSARRIMAEVGPRHPGVEVGLTGIEVVEADETDAATRDSAIASVVAFVLIGALLMLAFQSVKNPVMILVALLMGIAWSFGFTTVTVGHLQVISVVFAVILLGLGVAYGIHLASRFELVRFKYPDGVDGFAQSLRDTFETMGPGIITGAVTTAAAFATTTLTRFKGVSEMGFIAAAGIVQCLVAMFCIYPAMLRLVKPMHRQVVPITRRWVTFFDERWLMPFVRRPVLTLAVTAVVMVLSLAAVTQMRFDFDLMNLQPRNVDSVQWQNRVNEVGGESIWFAVSIVDNLADARTAKEKFLKLDTVEAVRGIGMLFPPDDDAKVARIKAVRQKMQKALTAALAVAAPPAPGAVPTPAPSTPRGPGDLPAANAPGLLDQVAALRVQLQAAALFDMPQVIRDALKQVGQAMDRLLATGFALDATQRQQRLDQVQREFTLWRHDTASRLNTMLDPSPLTPADFPAELMRPYRTGQGDQMRYALEIFPQLPDDPNSPVTNPLHPAFLPRFIEQLKSVDRRVTGVIVQIYESGHLIKTSYQLAGVYALLIVFLLVVLDFRSWADAVLSLVPVAVGFAVTFAVMWVIGMQVNAANIIVLPLMFGIGVDSGVHIIHRYRMDPHTRPLGMTEGTGKGITITSFTTMIGFGSMLLARHRGIASLGFVLTVGIGLTMLACWIVMPAWLELRERRKKGLKRGERGERGVEPQIIE